MGDRYANKGFSGKIRGATFKWAEGFQLLDSLLFSNLPQIFSQRLCELCVKSFFPSFSSPKKCIIMHFSPKFVRNMHYNALFHRSYPVHAPKIQSTRAFVFPPPCSIVDVAP